MKIGTLCYIKKDNKTLMLHRVKKENDIHEGKWIGLGGKVENGESPEECIVREVKEESGLDISAPILRGILTFPSFKNNEDWYVFLYICKAFTGQIEECNEGILQWVNDNEVMNLNMWEGDKIFLKCLEKDKVFSGKFVYENNELIDHEILFHN